MRKLTYIVFLLSTMFISTAGYAAEQSENNPLALKDGSHLFINDDGTMRMVDNDGKPFEMKEGVEMELEDGTLIMMKNKKIWRHKHREMMK
jgi:hypothetical protein